jgi:nucleoside-diphosphate-sugar epimerase
VPSPRVRVRPGRSGPVVAVTLAAGPAGSAVAAALAGRVGTPGGPRRVVAVDAVRGPVDGVTWRLADVTSPSVVECLAGVDLVVHVAAPTDLTEELRLSADRRRERAVRAAQAVATATAAVGARHLVGVTSAMVLGARPDNPVPLPDDHAGRAPADEGQVGDLLEVEQVLERAPLLRAGLDLTLLRPAALVGPGVDTVVTRHFEAPRLLTVRGSAALWQFCHLDDLGTAVAAVLAGRLTGPLTAGADGALTEEEVERATGMRPLELPAGLAFGTADRLHRVGVLPTPGTDLAFVVHPWVVGSQRLRDAGWVPAHDNLDCLTGVLAEVTGRHAVAGRRLERRDAAFGAAGAAVALLGTAAVLRQARSRHGRRSRP